MSPKAHALLAAAGKNHEGGVPDWLVALNDIPALLKSGTTGLLGVVVMTVQPAPSFFRLSPESILRLRQQITERLMRCVRPIDRLYSISQREGLVVWPDLRSSATLVMAMLKLRQQFEEVGREQVRRISSLGTERSSPSHGQCPTRSSSRLCRLGAARKFRAPAPPARSHRGHVGHR